MESEYWLSFAVAQSPGSVALHRFESGAQPVVLGSVLFSSGSRHASELIPAAGRLMGEAGISRVSRVIVSDGPGSFTGLRVGFSSAKALAMAWNATIETVHSAEPRVWGWIKKQPEFKGPKQIGVLTRMTPRKGVVSLFACETERVLFQKDLMVENDRLESVEKETLLIRDEGNPSPNLYALQAADLGTYLLQSQTRKSLPQIEDWIRAQPTYYADDHFRA